MLSALFGILATLFALFANFADSPERASVVIGSGIISALLAIAWK